MNNEDRKSKIKYKSRIKKKNGKYRANPDILNIEILPPDFSDRQSNLENQLDNSKIDSKTISIKLSQSINLDAKINHRKKREGD